MILAYGAVAAVVSYIGYALTAIGGGSAVAGAVQVAITAASLIYSNQQKKKQQAAARAAAARAKAEQQRMLAEQQRALRELSKLKGKELQTAVNDLSVMIKRAVVTRRIVYGRARVGGIWTNVETTGTNNDYIHLILTLCDGPIQEIEAIQFDDEIVTLDANGNGTGKWAGVLRIKQYLGTADQTADADFVAESSGKWTARHKLKGVAYLYIRIKFNTAIFPTLPEVSAIIKGQADIYDPRTGRTEYSDNAALCLAHYMTLPLRGPGIPRAEIDQDTLVHAANVCDQPVALLAGGTEPRYVVSGAIDLGDIVEDNLLKFTQAMAGDVVYTGGVYQIQAGEYQTPTLVLDESMLASGFITSNLQPRKDRPNVVKGTFVSEANSWQRQDFPSVSRSAYIEADGGQENVRDLTMELVQSGSQAQRLASIDLRATRYSRTFEATFNLKAFPARAGGAVFLNIPRYFDMVPMVVREAIFQVQSDGALTLKLALTETNAEIFEWDRTLEKQVNTPAAVNAKAPTVNAPSFSPPAGEFEVGDFPVAVTISTLTSGATIRWSTTAVPTDETEGAAYSGPVNVYEGDTLYARAFKSGLTASNPTIGAYVSE